MEIHSLAKQTDARKRNLSSFTLMLHSTHACWKLTGLLPTTAQIEQLFIAL